jgi:SAM-dependent methyltransferase
LTDAAAVRAELLDRLAGFMRTQSLATVAALGIADLVGEAPVAVGDIALRVGADESALYRLLRFLASEGVFAEVEGRRFRSTSLSDGLRSDEPLSARFIAIAFGREHYRAWAEALHAFTSGRPGFDHAFGSGYFDWLAGHPAESANFNQAMGAGARGRIELLAGHDWSGVRRVVDVGGGNGTVLAAILSQHPSPTGVLFDLPSVVGDAAAGLAAAGVADRCEIVAGDFFADPLPPADAIVLGQILHDWDDDRAGRILRGCRRAIAADGRLLILDGVLPEEPGPAWLKLFDLHMLVMLGGRERTAGEWRDLLAGEGFALGRITPGWAASLIEAAPAGH